jgi:hypothetical protein
MQIPAPLEKKIATDRAIRPAIDAAITDFEPWRRLLFLDDEQPEIEPSLLSQQWRDIIREPVIPFDLDERRTKLAHAYEILKPYIEGLQAEEASGRLRRRR